MVSKEVSLQHQQVLDELQEGDLVEFDRGLYKHWGVYIGGKKVMHRAPPDDITSSRAVNPGHLSSFSGVNFNKASVRKDDFSDVAGKNKARRNNSQDTKLHPLSGEEIVSNALAREGEVGYNLLSNNCEHFANECRYGESKSEQILVAFIAVIAVVAIGVCSWLFSKK